MRRFAFHQLRSLLSVLLLGLLCWQPAHAQNWKWLKGSANLGTTYASSKATATVLDAAGNTYVTGSFADTVSFGTIHLMTDNSADVYVAKLSPTGTWLWAVRAGGSGLDQAS